ncbi:MAG: DNA primase [Gemmataceae bacterium]
MARTRDLTKQVKEASDIVAVIGQYVQLRPAGATYKGLCPFHNDHRPSFQVDPRPQFLNYRCWSCGKAGDVFTFIQEYEKVGFLEARAMLAQRAGISLDDAEGPNVAKLAQLDAIRWAAEQYQMGLLDSPAAENARKYLGERKLLGETVRKFGLGYAPLNGDFLLERIRDTDIAVETLEEVGLIGKRQSGSGYYERFRNRIMFPVKNASGQIVGFGGRILPDSPLADRAPKYYNSADTPLFAKSELLYGLDLARHVAATAGYLAVVEGYTDVLMAHQMGVPQVVATMGTALNARHVQQLRRYAPRVVLVFDADEGGSTGVDRALEIFVSEKVDLAVASLPKGFDPCDLMQQQGPESFRRALEIAVDALDFKMNQMLAREANNGIEGKRRVIDAVLGVVALAPDAADPAMQMKRELIVTRMSHRLGVREETVWSRLRELRAARRETESRQPGDAPAERVAPAPEHERQLVQLLLANPTFVPAAMAEIRLDEITHPSARKIVGGLYNLQAEGEPPDLDGLRARLTDAKLTDAAMRLQSIGRESTADRPEWFRQLVAAFESLRHRDAKQELKNQLTAAADYATELELLRRVQNQKVSSDQPDIVPPTDSPSGA